MGRSFLQIVDIGHFNMKLNGRWFPQIVERDSGNLYPIYLFFIPLFWFLMTRGGGGGGRGWYQKRICQEQNCCVSFWTCWREISGDRVALFPYCSCIRIAAQRLKVSYPWIPCNGPKNLPLPCCASSDLLPYMYFPHVHVCDFTFDFACDLDERIYNQ